jgi:hypothetical protein
MVSERLTEKQIFARHWNSVVYLVDVERSPDDHDKILSARVAGHTSLKNLDRPDLEAAWRSAAAAEGYPEGEVLILLVQFPRFREPVTDRQASCPRPSW